MKLRTLSLGIVGAVTLGIGLVALSIWHISASIHDVGRFVQHRQETMALTLEFSKMTDLLTRLVRTYAVTGESRYLILYYDIANYRNGERKFSAAVSTDVWEQMIAGSRPREMESAEGMSFPDRLNAAGFSAEELDVFQRALAIGQKLHEIEQVAFAATQGLYDPTSKQFVSDGEPRRDFAIKLVYSDEYTGLEADLSRAIKVFTGLADRRTQTAFELAKVHLFHATMLTNVVLISVFLGAIGVGVFVQGRVLRPLVTLTSAVKRIGGGDYHSRAPHQPAFDEHGMLVAGVNAMAQAVEDDIAKRQEMMASLDAARTEAEAATRAKSVFLANMSHEIRTPMNAIMGMAHLALRSGMSPRNRDYVSKIDIAAKSLLSIINDILDFSKIEAGRLDIERLPFDLNRVIETSLLMVRDRVIMKEIELLLELDPNLVARPWLDGDGLRLGQVLNNLLSNAVKFTYHGLVRLTIGVVREDEAGRTLVFTVTDTGIGMTAEQRERLFQEFSQADGSITRKFGGTGLGLAICKRLVELMGGSIEVETEENRGATFRFTLPFGRVDETAAKRSWVESEVPIRALVVDDVPEAARALLSILAGFGVPAEPAGSGAEAVAMLKAAAAAGAPFTLAFIDWVMPLENGGELITKIQREATPCPDLVVVSAYDNESIQDALSLLGTGHFLAKPVLPDAMFRLLSAVTDGTTAPQAEDGGTDPWAGRRFPGLRVLLTEDNLINQQVALELLRDAGIEADLASNGRQAIDRLYSLPPEHYHLILMDLEMPVLDGLEATRLLRTDPRFRTLPVVAMTAHALAETRERCFSLGMAGHLTKPINTDELYALLADLHQRAKSRGTLAAEIAPAALSGLSESSEAPARAVAPSGRDPRPLLPTLAAGDGLRRLRFNHKSFDAMLALFLRNYEDSSDRLADAFKQGRLEECRQSAHGLKGVAGNLGATALADAAAALERALLALDPVEPLVTALGQELEAVLLEIRQFFASPGTDAAGALTPIAADDVGALNSAGAGSPGAQTARLDAPLSGRSVLLAEDNVINQMVVSGLLEGAGAAVSVAANGREAVERVASGRFDLVLMDVHMPELDGIAATREIRALPEPFRAAIPIVALTSSITAEDTDLYRSSGMNDVVAKPLRGPELISAIAQLVTGPGELPPASGRPLRDGGSQTVKTVDHLPG